MSPMMRTSNPCSRRHAGGGDLWKKLGFQVTEIIRTSLKENLAMIRDTGPICRPCKEVISMPSTFSTAMRQSEYALQTVRSPWRQVPATVALCDYPRRCDPLVIGEATRVWHRCSEDASRGGVGIPPITTLMRRRELDCRSRSRRATCAVRWSDSGNGAERMSGDHHSDLATENGL